MTIGSRLSGPESLTPEQQAAVASGAGRVLLVASAGSGKTEVLTRRLARILVDSTGASFRCLVVTYTVKAAQELRARIEAAVASEYWRVDADTLHGFALSWLRQYGECVDVLPNVVVYADNSDRAALIREYLASLGLADAIGSDEMGAIGPLLAEIDSHRTLRPRDEFPQDSGELLSVPKAELYDGYLAALDRVGGIDFPGMLTKLLDALDVDPWIGENFRSLFRHVLVDEAQDLTPVQTELLRTLTGDAVHVFAAADEQQSINGYAGGSFENARILVGAEAASHPLLLSHNFRSSQRIMAAAERLASHFGSRSTEGKVAETAPAGKVAALACADPMTEAATVADWAQRLLDEGLEPETIARGEDPAVAAEEIAVIGRTRWTLDPILAELDARGITCAVQVEASGFLSSPEGRICLDALALVANPADAPAERRVREEFRSAGVEAANGLCEAMENSGLDALETVAEVMELAGNSASLDAAFERLAVEEASSWAKDAAQIRTLWANYRAATPAKDRTVQRFLRHVAHVQRVRPSDPGIRVMTVHRVKGLEFKAVAVVGVREGTLPDYRARVAEEIDAERRGLYVAMTRASRDLFLTWPTRTQDRYGRTHHQQRSRFLEEAGL